MFSRGLKEIVHIGFLVWRRNLLNVSHLPKGPLSGWTWLMAASPQIEKDAPGDHGPRQSPHTSPLENWLQGWGESHWWREYAAGRGLWGPFQIGTLLLLMLLPFLFLFCLFGLPGLENDRSRWDLGGYLIWTPPTHFTCSVRQSPAVRSHWKRPVTGAG